MNRRQFPLFQEGERGLVTRREFLKITGASLAAGALGGRLLAEDPPGSPQRPPNILLILADDLGYGELSVQGCQDIPTPHIDSLAAYGVRFTNGYVSCPICAPTRAGLLTGRYQQRFGFETNPGPEQFADPKFGLPREEATLAERLKGLGYVTGLFGKWHLGYQPELQPTQRGFDEFFGFLSGANNYLAEKRRNRRNPLLRGTEPVVENEYLTDAFAREAVSFIERHRAHPFFLYLPFNAVHAPLEATDTYTARFPAITDPKRRTFAGMIAALDDAVGRVLTKLRELKLEEDTLIFFLSDNGGPTPQTTSGNGPLRGTKGQVYEGGIRVPFLVQWKGHLPAGQVCPHPVIALDLHPTALAAAGGAVAPEWKLDGVDLLPYLKGEKQGPPHDTLYWRFQQQRAIRQGDWKLVQSRRGMEWELYHLGEDIGEQHNLADKRPDRVKELREAWQAWNAELMEPQWVRPSRRQVRTGSGRRRALGVYRPLAAG